MLLIIPLEMECVLAVVLLARMLLTSNTIEDKGCVGDEACRTADYNTIGDGGCDGTCCACFDDVKNTIGNGGCDGNKAWRDAVNNTIGDESCVSEFKYTDYHTALEFF